MAKKSTLQVKGTTIRTLQHNGIDYNLHHGHRPSEKSCRA